MENTNPGDSEIKNLVEELSKGKEFTEQLRAHLNLQCSSSHETQEFLIRKILHCYDQALAVLEHECLGTRADVAGPSESPLSLFGSPPSDDSDQDFKDQASRKRKAVPSKTEKIKVNPGAEIESQLDDGFNWRKYGQKDIQGAKYPRDYYRCTHRHGQGCLATKHVQRSDEDNNTFKVTYRRTHTCNSYANSNNPPISTLDPQNEYPTPLPASEQSQSLSNTTLIVVTQDLAPNFENPPFDHPFNFTLSSSRIMHPENNGNYGGLEPNLGDYSNYFPTLTDFVNDNYGGIVSNLNINDSESELSPIVAAVTSTSNSPTVGTSLPFGPSEFGSDIWFGSPGRYT